MDELLAGLNEQQRFAVTLTEGPMLILAGAGSGKTRTITHRVAYLTEERAVPSTAILGVTFTNKAAEEMRTRLSSMLSSGRDLPLLSTFHSFCVRMLRRDAGCLGYRNDFTIYDSDDQRSLIKSILSEQRIDEKSLPHRQAASRISAAKNRSISPKQFLAQANRVDDELIAQVYEAYQKALVRNSAMDFDDLLLQSVRLLQEVPKAVEHYGHRFQYIVIDEYQDTNRPQYELVRLLTTYHSNLCVVGDEDQSIYRFRGADVNNILSFEKDYPGAVLVRLEQNYRSTQSILDAAGAVVANNVQRKGKKLWTDNQTGQQIALYEASTAEDEADHIAARVQDLLAPGKRIAILYRTNFQSRLFEETLRRYGVAYNIVGGISFYGRAEIKDLFAYLRTAINPDDSVSLLRILNTPARGLGKASVDLIVDAARREGLSAWQAIHQLLEQKALNQRATTALKGFSALMTEMQQAVGTCALPDLLERILERSGYQNMLTREDTDEAENRLMNLREVVNAAREHAERGESLQEFVDYAALIADVDSLNTQAQVILTTMHNAKGLEFNFVFLAGMEEGLFPHVRSGESVDDIEEERRLCYVGMTRAMERLSLSYARSRRMFGSDRTAQILPSRFLKEIPDALIEHQSRFGHFAEPRGSQARVAGNLPPPRRSSYAGPTYNTVEGVRNFLSKRSGQTSPAKPGSAPAASPGRAMREGARVFHEKYGYGIIERRETVGDDVKLTVKFPSFGQKKLIEKYANLKPA
ncbi:MAG: ATP-dependent helicase [Acidobacteriota bacterium]